MKTNLKRAFSFFALLSLLALASVQSPPQPAAAAAQRVVVFEGFYRPT